MSTERTRMPVSREQDSAIQRKPADFQEVPGEAEADAVREAFLRGAGAEPAGVAGALDSADGAMQARALRRLQRERGNAYVQRVVAETRGRPGRLVGLPQSDMVEEVRQRQDPGTPLPEGTRQQMEGYFGANLGAVRVHTGGEAATLSRELNANAFTVGTDIFFGEGKFNPGSRDGQATLAHELTHVMQQTGGRGVQRQGAEEEEEMVQMLRDPAVQRQNQQPDEEEELRREAIQREGAEEEEPTVA